MPKKRKGQYYEDLEHLVGRQVGVLRRMLSLTQAKVAERAGVTDKFISMVENTGANLSLHSIGALAKALECQPGDLLPHTKDPPKESRHATEAKALIDAIDSKKRKQLKLVLKLLEAFVEVG